MTTVTAIEMDMPSWVVRSPGDASRWLTRLACLAASLALVGCSDGERGDAAGGTGGTSGSGNGSAGTDSAGGSKATGGSKASGGSAGSASGGSAGSASGGSAGSASGDERIRVEGGKLTLCGSEIFINGANTPWQSWNDFGGAYEPSFWAEHYGALHDAGVNASRVWITCNGEVGIQIDAGGMIAGASEEHWAHLDDFFATARAQRVYVMATLMSFDHFQAGAAGSWLAMIQSDAAIDSYVANYLVPFLERYAQNPFLWSIDLMNEPDWVFEDGGVPWDRLRAYFARAARAIHEHSQVLVTVGLAMPKYQTNCDGCSGNEIGDAALAAVVPGAFIDFYSPHHYDWIAEVWGNPLDVTPSAYGYSEPKPYLIGEIPANGTVGHTLTEDVARSFTQGYGGIMPWTSNGVDANGGFSEVSTAARAFAASHGAQVFPTCP